MFNNTGIYVIKNIINEKKYIGSAININKRWYNHKNNLSFNKHHSIKLQNSWNKHGESSFVFEIVQICEKEKLIINEQYWINHFDSYENGYNCTPIAGSSLGRKDSEETKNKKSESGKKKIFSDEHRKKLSESLKGKKRNPLSEQHKINISKSCSGNFHTEESKSKISKSKIGHTVSEESRKKISQSLKGNISWNKGLKLIKKC